MTIGPIAPGVDVPQYVADTAGTRESAIVVVPVNADGSAMGGGTSASPEIVGGEYNLTLPTLTNGQTDALQLGNNGMLAVCGVQDGTPAADARNTVVGFGYRTATSHASPVFPLFTAGSVYNGATWDRARGDTTGAYIVETPTGSANNALTVSATSAVASSLVLKASAGNLYGYNIVAGASAGYLMIFNATTAPADGAVTPILCIPVAANVGLERQFAKPLRFTTGITMVFSTTGPFTKTASATAFLAGESL